LEEPELAPGGHPQISGTSSASDPPVRRACYTLADEPHETILVACSKCDWKAAFRRDELITAHGAACPMPSLLEQIVVEAPH